MLSIIGPCDIEAISESLNLIFVDNSTSHLDPIFDADISNLTIDKIENLLSWFEYSADEIRIDNNHGIIDIHIIYYENIPFN